MVNLDRLLIIITTTTSACHAWLQSIAKTQYIHVDVTVLPVDAYLNWGKHRYWTGLLLLILSHRGSYYCD